MVRARGQAMFTRPAPARNGLGAESAHSCSKGSVAAFKFQPQMFAVFLDGLSVHSACRRELNKQAVFRHYKYVPGVGF
jgi:hypothetical protein